MPADKQPYRVPSMEEIRALPWNGFSVASTFSGGGGSSTGYRMAGFKVLYANEFVEAARATYAANMGAHTHLDGRDIREVSPESVLERMGLKAGELSLLDGSPPCSAFSTAGKREKGWGKAKAYSDNKTQVVDDLFFEFARLLKGIQPQTFVAENVSGLVKGTAKGYFLNILRELKGCGYRVEAKLLDAQWLGVPQARQRLIFVGVREDLGRAPAFPMPFPCRYSVKDALPWLPIRSMVRGNEAFEPIWGKPDVPSPTIMASGARTSGFVEAPPIEPGSDMPGYAVGSEWDRLKPGGQSDKYFQLVRTDPGKPCQTVTASSGTTSTASVSHPYERRKFSIAELKRICAFPDDYKLLGSYQQQWERCGRSVPPLMMKAIAEAVRDRVLDPARNAGKL